MNPSLIDVCYEQIKDQYWYGLFGDFKLIIDRNTGYFNATKLCQAGGKKFKDWFKNKKSKELIAYFHNNEDGDYYLHHFIDIKKGNKDEIYNKIISGTYLPEDLILNLALWISNDFYVKCLKIIKSYYINEFNEKYKNDMCQLQERLQKIESDTVKYRLENEIYRYENEIYRQENERYRHENARYQTFEEDIAFKTANAQKLHTFALIKKNCTTSDHPYHVIRNQRVNYDTTIKRLSQKYPKLEIILQLEYNPNSFNLFNRIKEQVENIHVWYNDVKLLNGYTEEEFLLKINEIANLNVNSVMK